MAGSNDGMDPRTEVANFKLKHFQIDTITKSAGWTLKKLSTSGGTASGKTPLAGENVTGMVASGSTFGSGILFGNGDELKILVGKNNIGWNVAILEVGFGMGDQGNIKWPEIDSLEDGTVDVEGSWGNAAGLGSEVKMVEHSQPVNLKKDSKSGFTMVGWYKGWMKALPKLVDVFNIVDKVYYYDGATNTYVEIPKNSGSVGDWDGSSALAPNGKYADVWNININGGPMGIWVKVSKTKDDFETTGGRGTSSGLPKAPFVFLTYTH